MTIKAYAYTDYPWPVPVIMKPSDGVGAAYQAFGQGYVGDVKAEAGGVVVMLAMCSLDP